MWQVYLNNNTKISNVVTANAYSVQHYNFHHTKNEFIDLEKKEKDII